MCILCTYLTQQEHKMKNVQVVSIKEDGVFEGETTVAETLQRGNESVRCGGIVTWEGVDEGMFDEWKEFAQDGIDGFAIL